MKDEEKTNDELILELKILRKKYNELKGFLLQNKKFKEISGTETILVVDDNKFTRKAIIEMLRVYGYDVLDANSSQKAVKILKSQDNPVHLVLSDVVMPDVNGPEMVNKLIDLQPEIKVVFMSGYTEDEIIHDDVLKICNSQKAFIKKPFTLNEIGMKIRQELDKK